MKTINAIVKILTALATVAGAVYIIATYGDQIVAWAKGLMEKCPKCSIEITTEEAEEETPVQEAPAEETEEAAEAEEVSAEPVQETSGAPVADESDFEG